MMSESTFHILRQLINNLTIPLELGRGSSHRKERFSGFRRGCHRTVLRGSVLESSDGSF